ncbi:hypothetical protein PLCT2_00100 [Planctomycetaceae bacterium]|nr:hypothetical protein PLCT2_00100 [Planctomycetaceae bacterium]
MIESALDRPRSAFREGLLVFLFTVLAFGLLQTQPGMVQREDGSRYFGLRSRSLFVGDSPYNIRLAYLYRTGDVAKAGSHFHWMSSSIWTDNFCDKELLYHLYLAPFTLGARDAGDTSALIWGAKLAIAVMFAFLAFVFWAVLRGFGVKSAWCYVPLIAVMGGLVFMGRASEARAWPIGVICSLTAWLVMARNRRLDLLLVAAIYTLSYAPVHFLGLLWLVRTLGCLLLGPERTGATRGAELKRHLLLLAMIALGVVLGVLLHPGRADFIRLWVVAYVMIPAATLQGPLRDLVFNTVVALNFATEFPPGEAKRMKLGLEFLPQASTALLSTGGAAMLAPIVLPVTSAWHRHKPKRETLLAMGAALMTLGMAINSGRFFEIAGPFCALAVALWVQDLLQSRRMQMRIALRPVLFKRLRVVACACVFAAFGVLWLAHFDREPPMPRPWRDAAIWLRETPQARGKILFHANWDTFPDLFFYAPHTDYIVGMDPTFLLAHDVEKSRLYWDIVEDKVDATTVSRIRAMFKADYILVVGPINVALDQECRRLESLGALRRVYTDPTFDVAVYEFAP